MKSQVSNLSPSNHYLRTCIRYGFNLLEKKKKRVNNNKYICTDNFKWLLRNKYYPLIAHKSMVNTFLPLPLRFPLLYCNLTVLVQFLLILCPKTKNISWSVGDCDCLREFYHLQEKQNKKKTHATILRTFVSVCITSRGQE